MMLTDDASTVEFLSNLNNKKIKAKYHGVISDINILYSCPIEEMHPSIVAYIKSINLRKNKMTKLASGSSKSDKYLPPTQITPGTKYRGIEFLEDTVVVFITITEELSHEIGDKLVTSSQMKSVSAQVLDRPISTESGTEIDMLFSGKSVMNRIVNSPILTGTIERCLIKMEEDIVNMYFSE